MVNCNTSSSPTSVTVPSAHRTHALAFSPRSHPRVALTTDSTTPVLWLLYRQRTGMRGSRATGYPGRRMRWMYGVPWTRMTRYSTPR